MAAEKSKEKAKRGDRSNYFNLSIWEALIFLSLAFALLTIFTSNQSLAVLPHPRFFYWGSMAFGMILVAIGCLIFSSIFLRKNYLIFLLISMIVCAMISFIGLGVFGSWIFAIAYYSAFHQIPSILFPFLFLLSLLLIGLANYSQTLRQSLAARAISVCIVVLVGTYLWGYAAMFEGDSYDEALAIEGKTYHSIVYYGWLGDPGTVTLYECQGGYFFCTKIYEAPYDYYFVKGTSLVFDATNQVLKLEYQVPPERSDWGTEIPPILFEYAIP